jgi:hypothetical protein
MPELGTIKAPAPPIVIVTSNRTREIHDALKRRCLYHWVDYPDAARELAILRAKAPGRRERLSQPGRRLRPAPARSDLFKVPGVAETIDWATALTELDAVGLDPQAVNDTLGVLLKYQDDIRMPWLKAACIGVALLLVPLGWWTALWLAGTRMPAPVPSGPAGSGRAAGAQPSLARRSPMPSTMPARSPCRRSGRCC